MKYFLFIICFSLLLYQSIDLLNEFMSGKTVTNINYGIIRNTTLPGITLCPSNLDYRKLSLLNENVSILYKRYLREIENSSRSRIGDMTRYFFDSYLDALTIFFDSKSPNINVLNVEFRYSTAHGDFDNDLRRIGNNSYRMISLPMESMQINFIKKVPYVIKCYTLFSHSHSSWNNINIDFYYFLIKLKLNRHSIPISPGMFIPIMLHSPNTLPFENFNYISPGYKYVIRYSQWNIERLGKGYDTDCREYKSKKYTRSDCIFYCYQIIVKHHCQTQDFVGSNLLRRKRYFEEKNLNLSKCVVSDKVYYESLKLCENQCHKECQFTYYSFTISKYTEINMYHASFSINHNSLPDITIRYIPEMPLLTFICNFGGILGMWLGLSFYTIFHDIWKILHAYILSKFTNINTSINLFITTNFVSRKIIQPRNNNS